MLHPILSGCSSPVKSPISISIQLCVYICVCCGRCAVRGAPLFMYWAFRPVRWVRPPKVVVKICGLFLSDFLCILWLIHARPYTRLCQCEGFIRCWLSIDVCCPYLCVLFLSPFTMLSPSDWSYRSYQCWQFQSWKDCGRWVKICVLHSLYVNLLTLKVGVCFGQCPKFVWEGGSCVCVVCVVCVLCVCVCVCVKGEFYSV